MTNMRELAPIIHINDALACTVEIISPFQASTRASIDEAARAWRHRAIAWAHMRGHDVELEDETVVRAPRRVGVEIRDRPLLKKGEPKGTLHHAPDS
jgi:hypothetical protein